MVSGASIEGEGVEEERINASEVPAIVAVGRTTAIAALMRPIMDGIGVYSK